MAFACIIFANNNIQAIGKLELFFTKKRKNFLYLNLLFAFIIDLVCIDCQNLFYFRSPFSAQVHYDYFWVHHPPGSKLNVRVWELEMNGAWGATQRLLS